MKKIRLISFLALFLCAVMLLASCGGKSGSVKELAFNKVIAKSTAEEPATVTAEKLTLEGTVTTDDKYPFVVLTKEDATRVIYNLEQNKIVFTDSNTNPAITVNFVFQTPNDRTAYFAVQVTDATEAKVKEQTSLYDASGNQIVQVDGIKALSAPNFDLVSFGGKVYRLGDTSATATLTAVAYSALNGALPSIDQATEDYYYDFSGNDFDIYDKNLNLLTTYRVEGNPDSVVNMILKNGNVAVQLRYLLPDDAKDYAYYDGSDKIAMKTLIVNAKNGKTTEVSFDYFLLGGISLNVDLGWDIGIDNEMLKKDIVSFATICPISDGVLLSSATDRMLVALDAKLKVLGRIDALVDNQANGNIIQNIYPGYFTVNLVNGDTVLLDDKGKVVGNISGADDITYSYLYADGKIFNYALEEVYDYEANEYVLEDILEHSAIFSKENDGTTEYFLYTNGAFTAIDTKDDKLEYQFTYKGIYVVEDSTDLLNIKTTYYNDKGVAVLTLEKGATLTPVVDGDDFGLYGMIDPETSKPVYYRVAY